MPRRSAFGQEIDNGARKEMAVPARARRHEIAVHDHILVNVNSAHVPGIPPSKLLCTTTLRPRTSSGAGATSHIPWQIIPLMIPFSAKARMRNTVAGGETV